MDSKNSISEYAATLIRYKASQIVKKAGFSKSDQEDIEQEMMLEIIKSLPDQDPDRASAKTYVSKVINNKMLRIIRDSQRMKRDRRLQAYSLSETIKDNNDYLLEISQTLTEEDINKPRGIFRDREDLQDLAIDLDEAVSKLPPDLQSLCEALKEEKSVTDVSKRMGKSRKTIYQSIKKLREHFGDANLERYL